MKKTTLPIEFAVFIADPLNPSRELAYHLTVADVIDLEDGSPLILHNRRALTMGQATEAGYSLPKIIETLNVAAVAARDEAVSEVGRLQEELEKVEGRAVTAERAFANLSKLVPVANAESAVTER